MIQSTPNTSYLRYNAPSGAILPEQQQVALKDSLHQTKDDNPAVKAAENTTNDPKVLVGALGIGVLLEAIARRINKAISGEYKESFLGKIGATGDKISNFLHLNGLSGKSASVKTWASNNRLFKYFSSSYKTEPKNSFASAMAKGTMGELAQDASSIIKACQEQKIDLIEILGADRVEEILKNPIKHTDEIIKGLDKKGTEEFVKFGGKIKLPFIKNKITLPFFERKVYYSELSNKLKAISQKGATSGLGQSMSKGTLRTLEGLTNRMAGGPAAMLIQAFCFAQATKAAIDAPKGEKLSTFMENVFQDLGYYLVGATSINLMHSAGGNKYRGMTKESLARYRDLIKTTNEAAKTVDEAGFQAAQKALKSAKEESKLLLKGVSEDALNQYKALVAAGQLDKKALKAAKKAALKSADIKFWEKPLKFLGKVMSLGLDKFEPIIKHNDGKIMRFLKTLGSKTKGFPGGLGRFVLSMFVITPILIKPIVKLSHLIFGRPTKSVLDKETDEKEGKVDTTPAPDKSNPQSSTNYLDIMTKNNKANTPQTAQSPVQPAANASAPIASVPVAPSGVASQPVATDDAIAAKKIKKESDSENKDSTEVERTYIPSSVATQFPDAPDDYSKVDAIIQKADAVERSALKNL